MYEVKKNGSYRIIFTDTDGIYTDDPALMARGLPASKLYYWCNSMGEINLPADPMSIANPKDLPEVPWHLYETYQEETDWMRMYTVRFDGKEGILFTVLIDDNWVTRETGATVNAAFPVVKAVAEEAPQLDALFQNCDILAMERTDPDGSELAFFFSVDECDRVPEFRENTSRLAKMLYDRLQTVMGSHT